MRKQILTTALVLGTTATAWAGGFLTNSNQNAAFLRNPARDAYIAIDGCYYNPAGVGFMSEGWHMGFDIQSAYQTRTVETFFPFFQGGIVNGIANGQNQEKKFEGKATAPVIPSIDLARVGKRWFATFHFGITGGGGKCKFDDGLPSFESQVAMVPVLVNAINPGAVTGYSMDTYMQGRQYYFGGQFGVGYKLLPNLSVSAGGRVVYADCNYYGYVRNIQVQTAAGRVPAGTFFENANMPHFAALAGDRELNCDQTGWGFTPIIGVDYQLGKLNLAAKYEFKTRLRLKNRSGENTSGLEEYDDGKKLPADIPAILTLGAKYDVKDNVRLSAGFHYYFDKQATQYGAREEKLEGGGWEVLAGAEVDLNKRITVSAGWQTTNYGLGDNSRFISDMSFVTNSNSVGLGARIKLRERVALNVAYFKTIYKHYERKMDDYCDIKQTMGGMVTPLAQQLQAGAQKLQGVIANPNTPEADRLIAQQQLGIISGELGAIQQIATGLGSLSTAGRDNFHRTNDVFGIGLEIDF